MVARKRVEMRKDARSCGKMRVVAENRGELRENAGKCRKMRIVGGFAGGCGKITSALHSVTVMVQLSTVLSFSSLQKSKKLWSSS